MTKRESGPRPDPDGSTPAALHAGRLVAAVRDDPAERLRLAAGFYDQRAGGRSIRAYRRAEIAFMRWQIRCGVLSPLDGTQPGSPWWRAVNETLLRDTVEADLLCNGAPGQASTRGVGFWLTFLRRPAPLTWYRAHNASIVDGYLRHRDLVSAEGPLERFFMDVALLRVLYAHCLLVRPRLALGRLAMIGRFLGDPRRRAADLFLSLQNVLPDSYPLARASIETVLADENYLARIMDYGIIAPRIAQLYRAGRRRPGRAADRRALHRRVPGLRLAVRAPPRLADRPLPDRDRPCPRGGRTATPRGSATVETGWKI